MFYARVLGRPAQARPDQLSGASGGHNAALPPCRAACRAGPPARDAQGEQHHRRCTGFQHDDMAWYIVYAGHKTVSLALSSEPVALVLVPIPIGMLALGAAIEGALTHAAAKLGQCMAQCALLVHLSVGVTHISASPAGCCACGRV